MLAKRGSFDYATVLGTTGSHWAPEVYAEPLMGCPVAGQHVWGALRTEGSRALLIRHFMNEAAIRFLAYEAPDGEDFLFRPTPGYSGLCEIGTIDGEWGIAQPGSPPRFRFTTSELAGRWVERDVLDVTIAHHPVALQFATPDADEPLVYLARLFLVSEGRYLGQPVRDGVVLHEQVYVRSGHSWALTAHKRRLQGVWLVFVTRYADGTTDWGQICFGTRGWSFAVVVPADGEAILAHRPAARLSFGDDGYPQHAEFDLGPGGRWAWNPPERGGCGRIPLPGPPDTTPRWAEGVVTRCGDNRAIAFAHTWWESYRSHLG